ncbi:hypothetical protein OROMI_018915 [Orobanche minor]
MSFNGWWDLALQFYISWLSIIISRRVVNSYQIEGYLGSPNVSRVMDPYARFRQNESVVIESQMDKDIANFIVKSKMLIIPTRKQEVLLKCDLFGVVVIVKVLFTSTATSSVRPLMKLDKACQVMGSIIRDGKSTPLNYESWHKVPQDIKETLWSLAKSKYDRQDYSKKWILQKFGKQLNSWRNCVKKNCFNGEEDLPLQMSRRNNIAHSRRIHNHTTGSKSFARVAKEQAKMAEKENENLELSTQGCSKNDLFAQVMGPVRNGRVRMYGWSSPSLVFNDVRSGANRLAAIKSLQEHNKKLLDEVDDWKSLTTGVGRVKFDSDETQVVPPDNISLILNIANRVDLEFPSNDTCTSVDRNLQVVSRVYLKNILDPTTTIAVGTLYSTDPAQEVNGRELGAHHFEI